ncbi:MAG: hypothetical protein HOQ05_00840 [Corynebacteriales bacterium]|nr:hypothetical protein [Mycobacteriales bacterium]
MTGPHSPAEGEPETFPGLAANPSAPPAAFTSSDPTAAGTFRVSGTASPPPPIDNAAPPAYSAPPPPMPGAVTPQDAATVAIPDSSAVPQQGPSTLQAQVVYEDDEQWEPLEVALPPGTESAYVGLPEDPRLSEQRERTAALLDRGVLVLGGVSLITLILAIMQTLRGGATLLSWSFPVVFLALAVACYYFLNFMHKRPPNSVEVPLDLAEDLTDAIEARAELDARGLQVLEPEEYTEVLAEADDILKAASQAAVAALRADRAKEAAEAAPETADTNSADHDTERVRLRAETQTQVSALLGLADEVFGEWDDFDDEYDEYDEYDDEDVDYMYEEPRRVPTPRAAAINDDPEPASASAGAVPGYGWAAQPLPPEAPAEGYPASSVSPAPSTGTVQVARASTPVRATTYGQPIKAEPAEPEDTDPPKNA